mgnify:CR=1 FL=1
MPFTAAIPNTVHDIHDLLQTGLKQLELPAEQLVELQAQVYPLTKAVRERYKATKDSLAFHDTVAAASADLEGASATVRRNVGKLAEVEHVARLARIQLQQHVIEEKYRRPAGLLGREDGLRYAERQGEQTQLSG